MYVCDNSLGFFLSNGKKILYKKKKKNFWNELNTPEITKNRMNQLQYLLI